MPKYSHAPKSELDILHYVEKAIDDHPPIDKESADYTMADPAAVRDAIEPELMHSFATERAVDRNVKELGVLLHELPETDQVFIHTLWWPHEAHHAILLEGLLSNLGVEEPHVDLESISPSIRIARAMGRIPFMEDIFRLQYYLTGAATEKAATHLYRTMDRNLTEINELAIAETVIRPVKRQEPVHDGFYGFSAHLLASKMSQPQLYMAKVVRDMIYRPVGVIDQVSERRMGNLLLRNVGATGPELDAYVQTISRVERQILYANDQGMKVPPYIVARLRDSIDAHLSDH